MEYFIQQIHIGKNLRKINSKLFFLSSRRKDYIFYPQLIKQTCSDNRENNFNSVKHVNIDIKQIVNNSVKYCPNATQLSIRNYSKTSNNSIAISVTQILPLEQLSQLNIYYKDFDFKQLLELLRFTPNLHTIKYFSSFFNGIDLKSIQQTDIFQYVLNTNKIKRLEIHREGCSLEGFQIIMHLFPQLEYLQIGMSRNEIEQFIRYLPSKTNHKTRPLSFLCISHLRKKFIPELNRLIRSENLHDDYLIKVVNSDLFLWW
jgi:hypothetical protein